MQSIVQSVFSTSASVASGMSASVLDEYGVIRYDERAERRPSDLGAARAGSARRRGMTDEPPRKSSICSMRVGKRECRKSVWNISKICIVTITTSVSFPGHPSQAYLGPSFPQRVSVAVNNIEQHDGSELSLKVCPELDRQR